MTIDNARDGALFMAARGFKVFPLWGIIEHDGHFYDEETGELATKEDGSGKRPRGFWKDQATSDFDVISGWWEDSPHYNYGVMLGNGLLVVDCDTTDALENFESAFHEFEGTPPDTFGVKTARGFHFYFKGESFTFKLAQDTDLKAAGGYVVGPGSLSWAGTRYTVHDEDAEVWEAPEWICKRTRERPTVNGSGQPLKITEGNRNNGMAAIAGALLRQGIAHEDVESIILNVINPRYTDTPLDPQELERTVFKSMREWPVGDGAAITADLMSFRSVLEDRPISEVTDERFFKLHTDMKQWPEPEWLIPGHLQSEGVMQLHAPSYTGKTFFAIDLAMSVMNHTKWLGQEIKHPTYVTSTGEEVPKDHVLYILSEGGFDFRQRLDAWIEVHGGGDYDKIITIVEENLDLSRAEDWNRIGEEIINDERVLRVKNQIGLVIIDTQSMLIQTDENSNSDMSKVAVLLRSVAKALKAGILLVHHEGYVGQGNTRIGGRGASAFGAAMDVTMKLSAGAGHNLIELAFIKVKGAQLPHDSNHPYVGEIVQTEKSAAISAREQEQLQELRAAGNDFVARAEIELLQVPEGLSQTDLAERLGLRYNGADWRDLVRAMEDIPRFEKSRTARGNGYIWRIQTPESGV